MHFPGFIFAGTTALQSLFLWLAAAGFLIGGIVNASGRPAIRAEFEQLGFPGWWCRVTAALEIATAFLLLGSGTRIIGAALGSCIMLAAIAAIVRIGAYRKLAPPSLYLFLAILAGLGSRV